MIEDLRRACREAFTNEPVVAAYLHGSVAAGQPGPFSDVDVAVLLAEPASHTLDAALRYGRLLADASDVPDLDVRVLNGAALRFQGEVVQKGTALYGEDSPERVAFEVRTLKRYLDFEIHAEPMRRQFLEDVARGG